MDIDFDRILKYILEGLAVAVVAYLLLRDRLTQRELLTLALTSAVAFAILDQLTPVMGLGARMGAGVGLGLKLIGGGEEEYYYN